MESMKEKFKSIASHYRLIAGCKWHEVCNRDFIVALSRIEKNEFENFYNWLISEEILIRVKEELLLSEKGEVFVYGNDNDPTQKIFEELNRLDMCEGSCWQFASYNSFKNKLNPVEEKNFYCAIKQLVDKGILIENDFDRMLILTKTGEEKLKELFY